jgi:hypothetical protein
MAREERDQRFDKALGRHLRSARPSPEAARLPAIPASQGGACPDSETLAAYHERSLLPEELNSWKEHIVGCQDCQTILAQLEATDEISLPAARQQEVLALPRKKSRRVLLRRGARWQWLAPAGAIAAGLLVWIALHENQPRPQPSLKKIQVATKQAVPPPPLSVSPAPHDISPSPKAALKKPQSAADESAAANSWSAAEAMTSNEKLDSRARVTPSKPLAAKESGLPLDTARTSDVDLLRAEDQAARAANTFPDGRRENPELQLQAPTANAQSQNQYNANSPRVPGPAPLGRTDDKRTEMKTRRAAAAPEPAAGPAAGLAGATSIMEVATVSNPHLIAARGSNVVWRAGRAGLVEFSRDGGASWSRQTSGVLADLLTGSAPSEKVCWIVGRVGAILLTTDGGAHWTVISSPLSEDLGGIRATDAQHATIWNARNTKSFETSDGGLTWKPVPNP